MRKFTFQAKTIAFVLFISFFALLLNAKSVQSNESGKSELQMLSNTADRITFQNYIGIIESTIIGTEKGDFARLQIAKYTKSNQLGLSEIAPIRSYASKTKDFP